MNTPYHFLFHTKAQRHGGLLCLPLSLCFCAFVWALTAPTLANAAEQEQSPFFPFVVSYEAPQNVTNMAKYLDAPAGKHGFVRVEGDTFVNDAGEIRFWGTNLSGAANFPTHEQSERIAARLAKFGYNCVRLHWMDAWDIFGGWNPKNHTDFDPKRVDQLDYLIYALKKQGIYVNINLHVARWLDDRDGFPHKELRPQYDKGVGNFYPPMIEKQKEYAKMLLTHVNPYTKLAYTDEPAVAMVEITNEDSIILVWMNVWSNLSFDQLPDPYMAELRRQWNEFLKAKYGTTEAMKTAWAIINEPLGEELLPRGNFDTSFEINGDGWWLQTDEVVDCDAKVQDGLLRINVRKMGRVSWVPQIMYRRFTIEEGKPYTLSFRMRSDRPNRVHTSVSMDHEPWSALGVSTPLDLTTEWQTFTFQFLGGKTDDAVRWNITGMTVGWYELDDVTLRPGGSFDFPAERVAPLVISSPPVIPAQAGIQTNDVNPVSLDPRLRGGDVSYSLETGTVPTLKRSEAEKMPTVLRDWIEFLINIERKYFVGMYRYLKDELGVKVPISGTQLNYGSTRVQAELDYCDNHAYWNHPNWTGKQWDSTGWYVRNRALVNSADTDIFGPLATARVAGKPYTISEYNHPYPNQYAGEGLPMLAAFGRFQRWNGIFQYTYAHKVETEPDKLTGYFDMDVHALQLVHSPACSAMFMRVNPAIKRVSYGDHRMNGLIRSASSHGIIYLTAEEEIAILVRKLTPQALNFSGFSELGDIKDALHKITGLFISDREGAMFGRSSDNQEDIFWNNDQKDACYFMVNAPEIKVFTGFVRDREFVFEKIRESLGTGIISGPMYNVLSETIRLKPGKTALDFATISLLTLEDGAYLLTATGTMHNTNGEPRRREPANPWEANDMVTLENQWGDAPVLCEGVPLELTLPSGTWLVYPLDEAGNRRADPPLRFENEPIRVGPEYQTLWYEIRDGR